MIDAFYKKFQLKDYLQDNIEITDDVIDCTLGVNPFIDKQYMDSNYSGLKDKIIEVHNEDLGIKLSRSNISFGAWHYGYY